MYCHIYRYKHIYATRFLCTPIHSWGQMFLLRPCPVLPSNRFRWATESDLTSDSELTCPGDQFLDGSWNMRSSPFSTNKKTGEHVKFSMWNMRFSSFFFQLSISKLDLVFQKKMGEFTWSNLVAFEWGVPFFHRYQGLPWSAFFPPPISRNAQGALGQDKIRNETPAVAMVRSQKLTQLDLFPNSCSMSNHFRETSSKISIKGVNLFETGQGHNSPLFETGHISLSLLGHQRRWREQKDETRVHA